MQSGIGRRRRPNPGLHPGYEAGGLLHSGTSDSASRATCFKAMVVHSGPVSCIKVVAASKACSTDLSTPGNCDAQTKVSAASSTLRLLIGCRAIVSAADCRQPRPLGL